MSAGTIALILNFVFVFILIVGFLIGLWRGVKKASLNLGITLVGVLVGFFVSAPITKAVLGIKVSGGQTISQYLVSLITQNADIKLLYESTPSLQQTLEGLPFAIANPIMFLIVSIAIMLVTYLIYRIIACFIKKKDKEGNKIKQYRIAGGAVGLAKALILTLFISMPLVSVIGTANDLLNPPTQSYVAAAQTTEKNNGPLSSIVPKQAADIIDGLDTSAFGVIGNMFGLDNATFDYLSTFKINDETVQIRKEIDNVAQVYTAYEVFADTFSSSNSKFSEINFDKIKNSIDTLLNSKFYKTVVSDVAFNLISDSAQYSFFDGLRQGDLGDIIDQISQNINAKFDQCVADAQEENKTFTKSDYFANDINNIYSAFKTLAQSETLDTALAGDGDLIEKIKAIAENPDNLKAAFEDLFATNLFQTSAPAVINFALGQLNLGIGEIKLEVEKVDWATTNEHLANDIANLLNVYSNLDVDINAVLSDPESLLTSDSEIDIVTTFDGLGQIVDKIDNMQVYLKPESEGQDPQTKKLFVGADGDIVEVLLKKNEFSIPETLTEKFTGETKYQDFFNYVAEPLAKIQELDLYNLITEKNANKLIKLLAGELKKDADYAAQNPDPEDKKENTLELIVLRLFDIPKTNEILIPNLKQINNNLINFGLLSDERADWENDITQISELLVTLSGEAEEGTTYLDLAMEDVKSLLQSLSLKQGEVTITQILTPVLQATSTQGLKNSVFDTFESVMSKLLDSTITISEDADLNGQIEEVCNVFEAFVDLYADYNSLEDKTLLALYQRSQANVEALSSALKTNADHNGIFKDTYQAFKDKLDEIIRAIPGA